MRQGGNQYFALDLTDPAAASYPGYLWEFPREDAAASIAKQWIGQTWSEPVITKVRSPSTGTTRTRRSAGSRSSAAAIDQTGDPNSAASTACHATAGRSITMVDIEDRHGSLAQKTFVDTPTATDPAAVTYDPANPERSMLYAIASTPGVFDVDFDGFADVIYVGDLGGNMWKWVIKDIGHDAVNGDTRPPPSRPGTSRSSSGRRSIRRSPAAGPRHYRSFFFDAERDL